MASDCRDITDIGEGVCEGGAGSIGCQRTDEHTIHFNQTHCLIGHAWRSNTTEVRS